MNGFHDQHPLKVVLLDIDGTLLDSNDAHTLCWIEVLRRHGHALSYERVRPLIGMGGDKVLPELTGLAADWPEGKQIAEDRARLFHDEFLADLRPTPRARAMVERIHECGLRPVVATSATGEEVQALLRQAEVDDLFDTAADSDDAARSKPDSDIVHAALAKAGASPEEAVMVGDTPYDVQAARKAGVPSVALRCGGWWDDDELAGADAIYQDPAQLLDLWDRSPLAPRRDLTRMRS
jgi:HAD superfamily hydrolase (TIGR01509 family)